MTLGQVIVYDYISSANSSRTIVNTYSKDALYSRKFVKNDELSSIFYE